MKFLFPRKKILPLAELTDEELIARFFSSHDAATGGELFNRYTHLVFGVCLKYLKNEEEAKDAVMQVFEHLLGLTSDEEIRNFKGWLYTITKNHCLMKLRHEKAVEHARNEILQQDSAEIMELPMVEHLYEEEENQIQLKQLQNAIQQLRPEQQKCIELFYLEDKLYKEIAEMTGFDIKSVKSHIQNGRRNLKILMNDGKSR